MTNHLLYFTARWKLGHQVLKTKIAVIGRNILSIESIPEETPEYSEGTLSRVQLSSGERIPSVDTYETLIEAWDATLGDL